MVENPQRRFREISAANVAERADTTRSLLLRQGLLEQELKRQQLYQQRLNNQKRQQDDEDEQPQQQQQQESSLLDRLEQKKELPRPYTLFPSKDDPTLEQFELLKMQRQQEQTNHQPNHHGEQKRTIDALDGVTLFPLPPPHPPAASVAGQAADQLLLPNVKPQHMTMTATPGASISVTEPPYVLTPSTGGLYVPPHARPKNRAYLARPPLNKNRQFGPIGGKVLTTEFSHNNDDNNAAYHRQEVTQSASIGLSSQSTMSHTIPSTDVLTNMQQNQRSGFLVQFNQQMSHNSSALNSTSMNSTTDHQSMSFNFQQQNNQQQYQQQQQQQYHHQQQQQQMQMDMMHQFTIQQQQQQQQRQFIQMNNASSSMTIPSNMTSPSLQPSLTPTMHPLLPPPPPPPPHLSPGMHPFEPMLGTHPAQMQLFPPNMTRQQQQQLLQQPKALTPLFPKNKFILREHVPTERWPVRPRYKLSTRAISRLMMNRREQEDENARRIYREMVKFAQNEYELHLEFTPKLTIEERNLIHKFAEQLGMDHYLRGIEPMRHLTVSKRLDAGDEMQMIGYVGLFGHTVESIASLYINHIPQKYQMKRVKRDGPEHYVKIMEKSEMATALKNLPHVQDWERYFSHPKERATFEEWPMIQRQQKLLQIITNEIDLQDLRAVGLGELKSDHSRSKKRNHAYFVVLEWPSMRRIRHMLGLDVDYCPHLTLGFFPRDVHDNNDKNEETLVTTDTAPYPTTGDKERRMMSFLRYANIDSRYARSIMNLGFTTVESLKSMRRIDMNAVGFNSESEKRQFFEATSRLNTNMEGFEQWIAAMNAGTNIGVGLRGLDGVSSSRGSFA